MRVDRLGSGRGQTAGHLILAGGGHTHALVLRHWAMQPRRKPNAWITLVSRGSTALYSGMVPGLVAGHYSRDDCAIDLRRLADQAGVSFVQAEIIGLDLSQRQLLLIGRPPLRFDWLSLDVGSQTNLNSSDNATVSLQPVKPLEPFLAWCDDLRHEQSLQLIGSGAAAAELALALRARGHRPQLRTKPTGLDLGSAAANRLLQRVLQRAGVPATNGGAWGPASTPTTACTGSQAPPWLAASGLPVGERGRVLSEATLTVIGQPRLFASGDCAVIAGAERPPSGVWAVRAAPVLATNLQRAIGGRPLRRWHPQPRALQLLGDGGVSGSPRAIALWGPLALGPSRWLWRWKDRIDRGFMARLAQPGAMKPEPMACRGCAAKVGAGPLRAALGALPNSHVQDNDAALVGRSDAGELLLQSVDGFPALVSDPWLNARLTTLHACSDLWACGAAVTSAQAVVTLPVLAAPLQADLLQQTLAGVRSVLDPMGAQLLGGHTLEARDAMPAKGLSVMLTVNGSAPSGRSWPKGPLRSGDALILLRPIGTGVLFAAAMAGAAKPTWLDQALAVMEQNQAPAVAVLAAHGCHACADITGFGLLGHLGEMLRAGDVDHEDRGPDRAIGLRRPGIRLDAQALVQLALPGALELLEAGHASTLAPANAEALGLLQGPIELILDKPQPHNLSSDSAATPLSAIQLLLIDPQTCGPLLAALPAAEAAGAVSALRQQGFQQAAVIGRVG
ncbi:MAG: selenide, water dikinase SelD [Cyanobacteria bacterium K_Offshore_0m_m2_072]|nr:selenide, water dikinase SelD [Cyanobacteria bacterium K_Offshore_0m_m2_072]